MYATVSPADKGRTTRENHRGHVGDSGVQKHSCGDIYPWRIEFRGRPGSIKADLINEDGERVYTSHHSSIRLASRDCTSMAKSMLALQRAGL